MWIAGPIATLALQCPSTVFYQSLPRSKSIICTRWHCLLLLTFSITTPLTVACSQCLKRHITTVHDKKKKYQCEKCNKEFAQKSCLKIHFEAVHLHKKYKCNLCEKEYTQKADLKIHYSTFHEGVKDFKCDSCEKTFSLKRSLQSHISIIHEGKKDFKCDLCKTDFTTKSNLKYIFQQFMKRVRILVVNTATELSQIKF